MALPAFLSGSYRQYKEDQKVFTTWLCQVSKACGFKSETASSNEVKPKQPSSVISAPSQRLKGKARKLAKRNEGGHAVSVRPATKPVRSVDHKLSTAEMIARVQAVATSPKGQLIPEPVEAVLRRAIQARRRCAKWYQQSGANVAANDGHLHFISVLEDVLQSLAARQTERRVSNYTTSEEKMIHNRFEGLKVEDIDEEYPLTAADVLDISNKGATTHETHELNDLDVEVEGTFQLFCFFDDIHAIQDEIQAVWRRFQNSKVDLQTATIVTQAGLDMVRRLSEEQTSAQRNVHSQGSKHPHVNLALPVFYADAYESGEDPDQLLNSPKSLEHRPFDDFIYLPTTRTLLKFAEVAHKLHGKVDWPFPVPPLRFSYIARPELLDLPEYKQLEKDDQILTQILLDIYLIEDSKRLMGDHFGGDQGTLPILQDDLTKAAERLWTSGTVDTLTVFTARVLLDILGICGNAIPPLFVRELRQQSSRAAASMEFVMDSSRALDTREVRWLAKDQYLIMEIYQLLNVHIPDKAFPQLKSMFLAQSQTRPEAIRMEDLPPQARAAIRESMVARGVDPDDGPTEEHSRNAERLNIKMIKPAQEPDFLMTHNALHSGATSLRLSLLMEEAGVALANHHLSIFATAHLYNAMVQLGLTEIKWPEMERVIELQSPALFANDVPKTPEACFRRVAYRTGYTGASKNFDRKQPWKFHAGVASTSIRQLLERSKGSGVEHTLIQLEAQLDSHIEGNRNNRRVNTSGRQRQLRPGQVLSKYQECLPIVLKDMQINYITLTKTCNALIRALRQSLQENVALVVPSMRVEGDSNDHSIIYVVLLVLEKHFRKEGKGKELEVSAKVFEKFWRKKLARIVQ